MRAKERQEGRPEVRWAVAYSPVLGSWAGEPADKTLDTAKGHTERGKPS